MIDDRILQHTEKEKENEKKETEDWDLEWDGMEFVRSLFQRRRRLFKIKMEIYDGPYSSASSFSSSSSFN